MKKVALVLAAVAVTVGLSVTGALAKTAKKSAKKAVAKRATADTNAVPGDRQHQQPYAQEREILGAHSEHADDDEPAVGVRGLRQPGEHHRPDAAARSVRLVCGGSHRDP